MGNLKMTWNREYGRLVCHWVEFGQQGGPLKAGNVRGSADLTPRTPAPPSEGARRL